MSTVAIEEAGAPPAVPDPRPRRRWRGWGTGLLVVAVVAALGWVVGFSPVLSVRTVRVLGLHRLSAATVRDSARVAPGQPLIRVPRAAVERRIEALPEVSAARVELSFPSTVIITVTERVAAGFRQTSTDSWTFVDATGRSFSVLHRAPRDLPQLTPAPAVADDPGTLAALASVAGAVPAAVRGHVSEITATSPTSVLLILTDRRTVMWGSADSNADKARLLPTLLKRPGTVYDISNPALVWAR